MTGRELFRSSVIQRDRSTETPTGSEPVPIVEVRDVVKRFRIKRSDTDLHALGPITFDVAAGEFICVVGPSGCGKTSLLNILGGLDNPSAGLVRFHPRNPDQPLLSMVFQEQGVFPWMTVLDNAAFGLRARNVPRSERYARTHEMLDRVKLDGFADAYPHQLSGGMRQRVNLARAFVNDPEVLLMDEPFASLDEQTKALLQDDLLRVWEGSQKTVLFITHSVDEAIRLADRIVVLTARPGRIKADISVDIPRPRHVLALQSDEKFIQIRDSVWQHLEDEVLAAQAEEEEDVRPQ